MSKRSVRLFSYLPSLARLTRGIAFIKEQGVCFLLPSFFAFQIYLTLGFLSQCNKMSCPNCNTLSCYICRQVINGYDHFNQVSISGASLLFGFYPFLRWFLLIVLNAMALLFLLTIPFFPLLSCTYNPLILMSFLTSLIQRPLLLTFYHAHL